MSGGTPSTRALAWPPPIDEKSSNPRDLNFNPADEAFRSEVREFLAAKLPSRTAKKVRTGKRLSRDALAEWHAILNERNWLAAHWPVEHGGTGWSIAERYIFDHESALAAAPRSVPVVVSMLGPVLIRYGSDAQKAFYLRRILKGHDRWCQGYSEPGMGSYPAGLRMTAVRDPL